MSDHHFLVTVSDCDADQALQVMAERLNPEEDYGFKYTLDYSGVIGEPLFVLSTTDVEGVLRRPLLAGEKSSVIKTLEGGLGEWRDLLDGHEHDTAYSEMHAGGLAEGHWYREYGMDDWLKVTKVAFHGDTVLLWTEDVDGDSGETTLDADTMIALLTTNETLRT